MSFRVPSFEVPFLEKIFVTIFEVPNFSGGIVVVGLGSLFLIATEASAWILEGFASDKNQ